MSSTPRVAVGDRTSAQLRYRSLRDGVIAIMIAGLVAVLGAIVYKIGSGDKQESGSTVSRVPIEPGIEGRLDLPEGAEIQSVSLDGSNILLHLELPDGSRQLLIFGLNEGRILGRIAIE
jgi:hypothetical protein